MRFEEELIEKLFRELFNSREMRFRQLGLPHDLHAFGSGELSICSVCGAAEGQLLSSCPGRKLNAETLEACYRGNVVDIKYYRQRKAQG